MAIPTISKRKKDTHKGDYGHVFVIAGSAGMTGAAYLACEAALVSGAGLVTLAIPKSLNAVMAKKLTEAMTLSVPETENQSLARNSYKQIAGFAEKCDCVLIGPGLSQNRQTQAVIRSLIKNIVKPIIIDADALNALSGHLDILQRNRQIIITPHPGEMSRLIKSKSVFINKNKKTVAKKFSVKYNVTTVLKGHKTVVAASGRGLYVNNTGNPGMATAGCGDVLSGIISALVSSKMPLFKAAVTGVYVHGLAGDMAAQETGQVSLRARDVLRFLPEAFKKVYA